MAALPDGSYHPHKVTVEALDRDVLNLVVTAHPPEGDPFLVMGCGLPPGDDLTAAVNAKLAPMGLKVKTWGASVTEYGPPGLQLHAMRMTATTEEL